MYKINCAICHGYIGNGQGELVKNEKVLGVPNYKERKITIGSVRQEDLWKIAEYAKQIIYMHPELEYLKK